MRHVLRFLLALLSCGIAADTFSAPSSIYLRADKACTITEDLSWRSTVYKLDTAFTANDGGTWYGDARVFTQKDLVLSSSVTGYTTAWYTWAKDVSIREEGPKAATKFLSSDASIDLGARLDELPVNPSGIGLAYAKFTPITYSVAYDLAGGTHGTSHPTSATYDQPFTVSAPTLTGYAFAGWTWNDETYFAGETAAVTLSNLTVTNGATVTLTATWKPRQYGLDLVCGEGVSKIFYKVGSAADWLVVTQTTKVSVDNGTAWSAYAEPAYGYSLSGLGSSADDPAKGTISTAGGRFEPKPTKVSFAVKVTADPLESGTVSGSGSYLYESEAELTARPDTGHSFAGWSDGSTENPHKITVLCATNVMARFAAKSYELQLVLSDGIAALFYRLGGAGSYAQTNVTCTVLVPYGTTYEAYATTVPGSTTLPSATSARQESAGMPTMESTRLTRGSPMTMVCCLATIRAEAVSSQGNIPRLVRSGPSSSRDMRIRSQAKRQAVSEKTAAVSAGTVKGGST